MQDVSHCVMPLAYACHLPHDFVLYSRADVLQVGHMTVTSAHLYVQQVLHFKPLCAGI